MSEPQKPPVAFVVPADVFGAVAQYLTSRPYAEVVQLINALSQCTPHTEAANDAGT